MSLSALQHTQARQMGLTVTGAETLLSFIGIRPDLATFPMERYTNNNDDLTDLNFVETFNTTVIAAQAAGGGIVRIPPGTWNIGSDSLTVASAGDGIPIYVQGAGMGVTIIQVDFGYTGNAIYFTGDAADGAADLFFDGGLADLTIESTLDPSMSPVLSTGNAILIHSCINTQFVNLVFRNFVGGVGFNCENGDSTSQYIQMRNVKGAGNDINYKLFSFVNCQGYSVFSTSAQTNDFFMDDAKATFYGGNIQSSPPVCFLVSGTGSCQIVIHDFYYEGFAPTIFQLDSPSITSNQFSIYNFHLGGSPTTFALVAAFNDLSMAFVNKIGNATKILDIANGANAVLLNCSDPVASPSKFTIAAGAETSVVCLGTGTVCGSQATFIPRAAAGVTGPALFVDAADGSLKFKGAGGTLTPLAPT